MKVNAWQIEEIAKAVTEADKHGAEFVPHEKVADWLDSWGTDNEKEPPCR